MSQEYGAEIETASEYVATLLGVGFTLSAFYNLFKGQSMNKLLSYVNNLQIIVHMTLMRLVIPANAQVLMRFIFEMVCKFDLVDTSSLTATYYSPTEPMIEEKLFELGYESAFCLINMGSCLYLIFGQLIILFL